MQDPQNKIIDQATKTLIDKLLLEKIPLAGIARVVDGSEPWLQSYVNEKYQNVLQQVNVRVKKRALNHPVRWDVVVCGQQRQQAVDLVGIRCRNARTRRGIHR